MRLAHLIATLGLAFVMAIALPAQTVRVIFTTGEASMQRPDETAARPVVKGETVIIGARIITGADGRVVLTPMPGVKSIIAPNTTLVLESISENRTSETNVTHQAVLDLKQGAVVSDLQKPEGVSYDYSIRTARGLAGARGTTFTVGINAAGIQTIVVAHGSITVNFADGRQASLSMGQLSLTQAGGATKSVNNVSELPEADQKIAQNWVETTITAIATAMEAGIEVDSTALQNALDAAANLGITLTPETQAAVDRALAAVSTFEKVENIDPLEKVESNLQETKPNVVVTENQTSSETLTPLDLFRAKLTASQRAAFDKLPQDIKEQLVTLNDLDITVVALSPDPETGLANTDQDLRINLTALNELSPAARAFVKTLGGANLDQSPDLGQWSSDAFDRTLTSWNALTATERDLLTSIGAGEAIMDRSAGYISALLSSLDSTQLSLIKQAGWGAYLDELAGKPTAAYYFYTLQSLTAEQRAAVKFFELSPHDLNSYYTSSLVSALASFSDADQSLLRQLGLSEVALQDYYSMPTMAPMEVVTPDYTGRLNNALAFYAQLSSDEKAAARALGLGHLFYHYAPAETVGESSMTAMQRVKMLTQFYIDHPDLRQALQDSQLFANYSFLEDPAANDLDLAASTLQTYLNLPARTRNYLASQDHWANFFHLANPELLGKSSPLRTLSQINSILGALSSEEFAALLDLNLSRVVLEKGESYEGGVNPFPFIEGSPIDELQATIAYFRQLTIAKKNVLRELGIVGSQNIAVVGADTDGLSRLLTAYDNLPGTLRAATEKLDEYHAYYSTYGSTEGSVQDRSFFFPRGYSPDTVLYAVGFESTGNLHVGATRYLRIDGSYRNGDTFTVGDNKNLYLHASDLIDLNATGFSANIRSITMAAATINLSNLVFPEGSVASLNSKFGQVNFGPDSKYGWVNFDNVRYGNSENPALTSGNFANQTRGNVVFGTLKNPASSPDYTPRPILNKK